MKCLWRDERSIILSEIRRRRVLSKSQLCKGGCKLYGPFLQSKAREIC